GMAARCPGNTFSRLPMVAASAESMPISFSACPMMASVVVGPSSTLGNIRGPLVQGGGGSSGAIISVGRARIGLRRPAGGASLRCSAVERAYRVGDVLAHARERTTVGGDKRVVVLLRGRPANGGAAGLRLRVLGPAYDPDRIERRGLA